ncbi:MAG: gliding motility-associated C-terminal domain-containing protein [Bacteroidales bacterium]|nr:gliding motility-associated C-terminal domain-containing protein [Bacteroidales bacterium]
MNRLFLVIVSIFCWVGLNAQNPIIPDTVRSCRVDSLKLEGQLGFDEYLWSNGDTTYYTYVYNSGFYYLNVKAADTIDKNDSVYVNIINAGIETNDTTITCGDTIVLRATTGDYEYFWFPSNASSDTLVVFPRDTILYLMTISDIDTSYNYCQDSIRIQVEPIVFLDTLIQYKMGCPGENRAEAEVSVSGGFPPYEYTWSQGDPEFGNPSYALGLVDGSLTITVTDTIGCFNRKVYQIEAYPLPDIELYSEPDDTIFIEKPFITFSFENPLYDSLGVDTFQLTSWLWDFDDKVTSIAESPQHTYTSVNTYDVVYKFTTFYGCEGEDTIQIRVEPVKLKITSALTPNGDGANDYFEVYREDAGSEEGGEGTFKSVNVATDPIDLNEYYLSNKLIVFNRWGKKVFETENYQNDWDGGDLVDGVYFYILICDGQYEDKTYKGSVMIIRKEF